ncbi:GtrA family protein [uncultured Shewanella sp.]|uniref:GtrA family protein n=1 Tax=uncultured Shewanella sp. TaxID=173975 RepID=UPI0026087943|nr:GtrA family protein [uncultured Shewanella sp.]
MRKIIKYVMNIHYEPVRFLLVGGSVFIIDMVIFIMLYQWEAMSTFKARLMAFLVATILTWMGNRYFTFRHRTQIDRGFQFTIALVISCFAAGINLAVFYVLNAFLPGTITFASLALSIGVLTGLAVNWCGSTWIIYRHIKQ